MERKIYRLEHAEFEILMRQLAERIKQTDHTFQQIYAISRGGLVPATRLAYLLDIPEIQAIGINSYKRKKRGRVYRYSDLPRKISNALIIDDVVCTGETLKLLYNNVELKDCMFITIFRQDDYEYPFEVVYAKHTYDWIKFFWEDHE